MLYIIFKLSNYIHGVICNFKIIKLQRFHQLQVRVSDASFLFLFFSLFLKAAVHHFNISHTFTVSPSLTNEIPTRINFIILAYIILLIYLNMFFPHTYTYLIFLHIFYVPKYKINIDF